jgi:toxin ParE1/3/4
VSVPRVLRTAQAEQDLIDIWTYIAPFNRAAADKILRVLNTKSLMLADNPYLGMARTDIAQGVRHFPIGSYLILYRALDDGIEILRYAHGRRRLQDLIK